MSKIVNLRSVRKAQVRVKKRAEGDGNAAKYGRTTAERKLEDARADKARTRLDGHERERE